ncbi:beta-glucosidase 24-like [Tripterygium wilfordii]|uniref:beta-glucosidase 24-like n=1 Tax=Tripterygium wilfordii TaxID=458696 RepID=UPI0018F854AB|nr:beta-glucosidase 24-like [Tripterygium wilfordii]
MAVIIRSLVLVLVSLLWFSLLIDSSIADPLQYCDAPYFDSSNFPDKFHFGAATAAYQVEGAAFVGRGPSIWDNFTHTYPDRIADQSNGDVAVDFYYRYKEDIKRIKEMNLDSFRFSISWSRLLPNGKLSGSVSEEGVAFYNDLIDEIISNGLTPFVTIFHWDTPQALDEEYGNFLSYDIVSDFQDYAEQCFLLFGDRVKHWITLNEPVSYTNSGYNLGTFAPGRCSKFMNNACQAGNSSTEPYIVTHNLLLAHGAAVQLYREKYQEAQKGKIGITLISYWFEPYNSENPLDSVAASTAVDFMFGWYLGPITFGKYPQSMITNVGDRLPVFTAEQSKMLIGSIDFLGLNYYTTYYAAYNDTISDISYTSDQHLTVHYSIEGIPIGPQATGSKWIYIYPNGIRYLLNYTKDTYNVSLIYITENGIGEADNSSLTLNEALYDPWRKEYYRCHLWNVLRSRNEYNVNVQGYFAWSLMDNFEWADGYTTRFGLYYIDYKDSFKRYAKNSVEWFMQFLKTNKQKS